MARSAVVIRFARSFLRTDKGRRVSASVLRGAAGVADRATGAKHTARIESARSAAERGLRRI